MNYRHLYHAGNFADVLKHAALGILLAALHKKDKAFFVLDTHAGIGAYDLTAEGPSKTREFERGARRVFELPAPPQVLARYVAALRDANPQGGLRNYPGSPRIIRDLLRPQDRMAAVELHPEDQQTLKAYFRNDKQVGVHALDGYAALTALLPPKERRGLVFIDPSYEVDDEFALVLDGLSVAHARFGNGVYCAWYPIADLGQVARFKRALTRTGITRILECEFIRRASGLGMMGSGLVIINPPYQTFDELKALHVALMPVLDGASCNVSWLVPERG